MSADAVNLPAPPPIEAEHTLSPAQWGMLAFLLSEAAFFTTLVAAYVAFMGQDTSGPTPREALSLGMAVCGTLCLVASSLTIHAAERAIEYDRQARFRALWSLTILLGLAFLAITAYEWHDLLYEKKLTISRNLFGTTYYTLVGFHALHVTGGVVTMLIVLGLALAGQISRTSTAGVQMVSWYWHFVDVVWLVVFGVVYVASRTGAA